MRSISGAKRNELRSLRRAQNKESENREIPHCVQDDFIKKG